jgi:hypothetical protein
LGDFDNPDPAQRFDNGAHGSFIGDGLQRVAFEDIRLDLGTFIDRVFGPVLDEVQRFTRPLQPIIDVLLTPIPVLSDLGPPVTLLDLAEVFGNVDLGMVQTVAEIVDLINQLAGLPSDNTGIMIPFGDFVIYDVNDPATADYTIWEDGWNAVTDLGDQLGTDLDNIAQASGFILGQVLGGATYEDPTQQKFAAGFDQSEGFTFPFLESPKEIFGMLLGRPATLIKYDLPAFTLTLPFNLPPIPVPPLPILSVAFGGHIGATIDFHAIGYDTFGLQSFADSGFVNPLKIFDGFFIDDLGTDGGADLPELELFGGVYAACRSRTSTSCRAMAPPRARSRSTSSAASAGRRARRASRSGSARSRAN